MGRRVPKSLGRLEICAEIYRWWRGVFFACSTKRQLHSSQKNTWPNEKMKNPAEQRLTAEALAPRSSRTIHAGNSEPTHMEGKRTYNSLCIRDEEDTLLRDIGRTLRAMGPVVEYPAEHKVPQPRSGSHRPSTYGFHARHWEL